MFAEVRKTAWLALLLCGCQTELKGPAGSMDGGVASRPDGGSTGDGGGSGDAGGTGDAGDETPPVQASYVRFKGGERIAADLSAALDLPRAELCRELGAFDCFDVVHQVVLGGVEPYTLRIDEASPEPAVATPLAVERTAWAACERAVERDLTDAPVVFGDLIEDPSSGREAAAVRLVERMLGRRAEPGEAARLAGFRPEAEAREWAVGVCFVVATSAEALFY